MEITKKSQCQKLNTYTFFAPVFPLYFTAPWLVPEPFTFLSGNKKKIRNSLLWNSGRTASHCGFMTLQALSYSLVMACYKWHHRSPHCGWARGAADGYITAKRLDLAEKGLGGGGRYLRRSSRFFFSLELFAAPTSFFLITKFAPWQLTTTNSEQSLTEWYVIPILLLLYSAQCPKHLMMITKTQCIVQLRSTSQCW